MKKTGFFFAALALGGILACNASKKATKPKSEEKPSPTVAAEPKATAPDPVKTLPSGLQYQIIRHGNGTRKPVLNDRLEFSLTVSMEDSVIFDSHKMNNNKPVPLQVTKPKFKGDPVEGYMMMAEGDSAVFMLPTDTLLKSGGQQMPPWMKEGKRLIYNVAMISIKSDSEAKAEAEMKVARQKTIDDSVLQDFFTRNNLHPVKTASGLYYIMKEEGVGAVAQKGNILKIFYMGKFLNGNIFDTNQDSTFHHQDALKVELGRGKVIKGWDEGLALMKRGSKATFYIPSHLGYGPKDRGPIPGNSVLVFDVDVRDVLTPEEMDERSLQDYFVANKINPLKTDSGVYYTIKKKGKGPNAKAGQTVSVRYTGMLLDGTKFDSNMDSAFHHDVDFKFELGKGRVIKGWDDGIAALNKGTEATLYIPSRLGYGASGQGRKIPPNSVLIFDVKLVDITTPPAVNPSWDPKGKTK